MAFDTSNTIFALTYNICWGCMTNSDKDATGIVVAKDCIAKSKDKSKLFPCVDNLKTTLNKIENNSGGYSFDFVGLQEASNWNKILDAQSLNKMMYVHTKNGNAELIIFYNQDKFTLNAIQYGTIATPGRPFIILFLTKKNDEEPYVVINMHNAHNIDVQTLMKELSKQGTNGIRIDSSNPIQNFQNIELQPVVDISDIIQREHNIIVMGDTNDHGHNNYWNTANNFQILRQKVFCTKQPPNSCCKISPNTGNYNLYGDYIMTNDKLTFITDNTIPEANLIEPVSDHKPVYAILQQTPKIKMHKIKMYKLKDSNYPKTLRLQNDITDPNAQYDGKLNRYFFRGHTINNKNKLCFPNGTPTDKGLVLVEGTTNGNIGYVQDKYIQRNSATDPKLTIERTARLQNDLTDPNAVAVRVSDGKLNNEPFKGVQINNPIKFADGKPTDKGLVLVQDCTDPNIIGYVQQVYLEEIPQAGGNKKKYGRKRKYTIKRKYKSKSKFNGKTNKKC